MMRLNAIIPAVAALMVTGCVVGIDPPEFTDPVFIAGGTFPFGTEAMCFNANQTVLTCDSTLTNLPKTWPVVNVDMEGFLIDAHEVTNRQYDYCVQMGNCDLPAYDNIANGETYYSNPMYAEYPVVNVTFEMAEKYCEFAGGRLPTEIEWERVAGGPSTVANPKRIVPSDKVTYAKVRACGSKPVGITIKWCTAVSRPSAVTTSTDDVLVDTVGGVKIFDMAGNVSEWTTGRYRENLTCAADLPVNCDCWACDAGDSSCKENCYTTCTWCSDNANCYVQCEDDVSGIGLPVCIAYPGSVEMSELVDHATNGERVLKGGNYNTDSSSTCQVTVSSRTNHLSMAESKPTVGFRCAYDVNSGSVAE